MAVYVVLLIMGLTFVTLAVASSYTIRHIDPKKIICTCIHIRFSQQTRSFCYTSSLSRTSTGLWLLISMCMAISIDFCTDINLLITFLVIFMSCITCMTQVMAVAVNLFPTNYRSMATSFIIMCGRIGGAFGSNAIGFFLAGYCTWIYYFAAGALICK